MFVFVAGLVGVETATGLRLVGKRSLGLWWVVVRVFVRTQKSKTTFVGSCGRSAVGVRSFGMEVEPVLQRR